MNMKNFESPKFWKGIKKKRKLRNILFSIFMVPTVLLGIIGFFGETPEVHILAIIWLIPALLFFIAFYLSEKKVERIINSFSRLV